MINITQQQALEFEDRIIKALSTHFADKTNWKSYKYGSDSMRIYQPLSVAELFERSGFKNISSTMFERTRKDMVRSGQIQIFNMRLIHDGSYCIKARNMATSWVHLRLLECNPEKTFHYMYSWASTQGPANVPSDFDVPDNGTANVCPFITYFVKNDGGAQ